MAKEELIEFVHNEIGNVTLEELDITNEELASVNLNENNTQKSELGDFERDPPIPL